MKKIIALTGQAGAGKDTLAKLIIEHAPLTGDESDRWVKMSFASHLKDVVALLFHMDRNMLEGVTPEDRAKREEPDEFWSDKMGKSFTPRYALQYVGTDLLRNQLHKNIWVDCLEKKIDESEHSVLVTDVRFKNEIQMLRRKGAMFVRMEFEKRPYYWDVVYKNNLFESLTSDEERKLKEINETVHPSETDWIGMDNPSYVFTHRNSIDLLKDDLMSSDLWKWIINKE
jgi:hypothetical protein